LTRGALEQRCEIICAATDLAHLPNNLVAIYEQEMSISRQSKRVAIVLGTRPEAVKLAPLILGLEREHWQIDVCTTGQHREMLAPILCTFNVRPDINFDLMTPNQTLAALSARCITAADSYFAKTKPDLAIVQGDTTTAFCTTLAAFYHNIPVAHVEAGLRTGDLSQPWPEEANRALISRLAALHFCPTISAKRNLLREGIDECSILVTGNTVIDALFLALVKVANAPQEIAGLPLSWRNAEWGRNPLVLVTGHRRENFGNGFGEICKAIACLADRFPQASFVYPVHLNPNVQEPVNRILRRPNIYLLPPLSYLPFVELLSRCTIVLTDSGGIQEEAPSLGKPVLVMREVTERPEAVEAGTVKLVGANAATIAREVSALLTDSARYRSMGTAQNPYGDGHATERIIGGIAHFFERDNAILARSAFSHRRDTDYGRSQVAFSRR
jgi:UDP-N-acetylglucosamine 2-epimerase (non-hydrolysing)